MRYVYPAIFTPAEEGGYLVDFPDIQGCYTDGDDIADAMLYAEDVLPFTLAYYEDNHIDIPDSTPINQIKAPENGFVSMVVADTVEYRKKINSRAVKKTLSIPQWLDTLAVRANVNFSNCLQKALIKELGID